jgi:hypothetical protein
VARGHEFVHPPCGKLDHEVTADEHREDLPAVAQPAAPETAAAVRQRHAVGVAELAEEILEPHFRRRVWRHDDTVSPLPGTRPARDVLSSGRCRPRSPTGLCQQVKGDALAEEDLMNSADLILDAFGRIRETVSDTIYGLTPTQLAYRVEADANPIAWLVWHLTRIQDDHVAAAFGVPQVWQTGGWAARFGLHADSMEIGYGHNKLQVAAVADAVSSSGVLADYHEATYEQNVKLVSGITDAELDRVVDTSWRPPVTLGVRLVSVINDSMQHAGQAAYVRGIVLRAQSAGD